MSLDMSGHIDDTFVSTPATATRFAPGVYVDGRYIAGVATASAHRVNLQPASDREIDQLVDGGVRVVDVRRAYVNDGDLYSLTKSDEWRFTNVDGVFKTVGMDNRPWRNYCKLMLSRIDDE